MDAVVRLAADIQQSRNTRKGAGFEGGGEEVGRGRGAPVMVGRGLDISWALLFQKKK